MVTVRLDLTATVGEIRYKIRYKELKMYKAAPKRTQSPNHLPVITTGPLQQPTTRIYRIKIIIII